MLYRSTLGWVKLDEQCPSIDSYYTLRRNMAKYQEETGVDLFDRCYNSRHYLCRVWCERHRRRNRQQGWHLVLWWCWCHERDRPLRARYHDIQELLTHKGLLIHKSSKQASFNHLIIKSIPFLIVHLPIVHRAVYVLPLGGVRWQNVHSETIEQSFRNRSTSR